MKFELKNDKKTSQEDWCSPTLKNKTKNSKCPKCESGTMVKKSDLLQKHLHPSKGVGRIPHREHHLAAIWTLGRRLMFNNG